MKRKATQQAWRAAALGLVAIMPAAALAKDTPALKGWKPIAAADWKAVSATDLMDIVAPAYQGFPESAEGKQQLAIDVVRAPDGDGFTATVTKQGLLDDAVGAEQIRLEIARKDANWHLLSAHTRWQCRRGIMAGSWTASRCP